jgi:hypothetical protein
MSVHGYFESCEQSRDSVDFLGLDSRRQVDSIIFAIHFLDRQGILSPKGGGIQGAYEGYR